MIAGGEIAIFDLTSGELIAIKRGFRLGGPVRRSRTGIYWPVGDVCGGDSRSGFAVSEFITRVLQAEPTK